MREAVDELGGDATKINPLAAGLAYGDDCFVAAAGNSGL
jgi:hypothetical protein